MRKPRPSDFARTPRTSLKQVLKLPSLKVTAKAAPTSKARNQVNIAYGIDSLDKLVDAFDERERALKKM